MAQYDGTVDKLPPREDTDFQFLAENSVDVIFRSTPDRVIRYVSPSSLHVLGWNSEEMIGRTFDPFIFPEDLPMVFAAVERSLRPGVEKESATLRMYKKDRSLVWTETNARVIRDPLTGGVIEFVLVLRDVTERKILEEKLANLALVDGLTGLSNRRAFDVALDYEWNRTLREGSQISLLLLDVDHFKRFNDQYGHQVGDDCLRAIASAIRGAVRSIDIAARYGGEEIAVILPTTDAEGARETAEKVRSAIEALRLSHEGNPEGRGWVTGSIGAATALARCGGTMRMPEGLLLAADNALYKAKHEGRNRVSTALLMAPSNSR